MTTGDAKDGQPLLELKQHLVLYLETPPGPKTARAVYDRYTARFGKRIAKYRPTTPGIYLRDWNAGKKLVFEADELPRLRTKNDWGYLFWDGRPVDSYKFLFHGYGNASAPHKASVFRFEFPWNLSSATLREFTLEVLECTECLSGTAGYHLEGRPLSNYDVPSHDRMCAAAHRYWGAEAQNLDVTLNHVREGFKCVNWLTILGAKFCEAHPGAVVAARAASDSTFETPNAAVLQIEQQPRLIDRNRREPLGNYAAVAEALLPIQIVEHEGFGGRLWNENNTMRYLRRFTHPHLV